MNRLCGSGNKIVTNPLCPSCGARAFLKVNAPIELGAPVRALCNKCGEFTLERRKGVRFVVTRTSDVYGKNPVVMELNLEDIMALAATKPYYVLRIKHRSLQVQEPLPELEIVDAYD